MAARDRVTGHILVTDDDAAIRTYLTTLLTGEGHRVTTAADGREALARFAAEPPDLVLLDLDMPRLGGFAVCRQLKQDPRSRLVPVLILTGRSPGDARREAWEQGADDFLTKPFQHLDVLARCRSLLRVKRLTDALDSAEAVVFAFARAVEAKSPYTRGHSERVTEYALRLAAELGLPKDDCESLQRGGLLHDLGKIKIPDAILDKPGALTAAEYAVVQQHPVEGERILQGLRSVRDALPLVRWHHERLDGRGYPDGLMGGAIPLLVRILSVADVYDALTSARPYRPALSPADGLMVLHQDAAGGGLDPVLVAHFTTVITGRSPLDTANLQRLLPPGTAASAPAPAGVQTGPLEKSPRSGSA